MAATTLKVILKGEDWTFTKKFLIYEKVILDDYDPVVADCIQATKNLLNVPAEDAEVKSSLVLK